MSLAQDTVRKIVHAGAIIALADGGSFCSDANAEYQLIA
jgi:hypothetical protein